MSNLSNFLNPVQVKQTKEVVISDRFVKRDKEGNPILDESGNPVLQPFTIRSLTQDENELLLRKSTRIEFVKGQKTETTDTTAYSRALVVAGTVDPDFSSEEMCKAFGVLDPSMIPTKMLLIGEYGRLMKEITTLSGLNPDDVEEELKN